MAKYKILHNPKCSKSRNALALLESKGLDFEVQEYLNETPKEKEIKDILSFAQGFGINDLIRAKEAKEFGVEKNSSENELVKSIVKYPKIMQRPVVIKGKKAVIARDENWFEKL